MVARRLGHTVLLIERGHHPRVVIGESSTPLSNLLLEQIADRYDLPGIRSFSKWGTWKAHHPEIPCGRKRGFTFVHHSSNIHPPASLDNNNLFLVAANPHDTIADTHWYRADFDHFLLNHARDLGAEYFDDTRITAVQEQEEAIHLTAQRSGATQHIRANFVVDATGPRGCLHHLLQLGELPVSEHPATQALYTHFTQVSRLPANQSNYPYPVEDAAVHHLFKEGWIWVLHFDHGVTSAGAVINDAYAQELRLDEGEHAWARLLESFPLLKKQFSIARATMPFRHISRLPFRSSSIAGDRWVLLPSAAGFVDPMLSTGFPLTLLGIQRLSAIIEQHSLKAAMRHALADYADVTQREFMATAALLSALNANKNNPVAFRAIAMLYFAAVSFSETAHRLGKPELARSFLLIDDPTYGPSSQTLLNRAKHALSVQKTDSFIEDVMQCIVPFDVAGLSTPRDMPWYPVDAEDLRRSAWKLGASTDEIEQMLIQSGFTSLS